MLPLKSIDYFILLRKHFILIVFVGSTLSLSSFTLIAQHQDSVGRGKVKPKMIHIQSHGYFMADTLVSGSSELPMPELRTLSLVDKDIFLDWDNQQKILADKYKGQNVLIAVSADDTPQRTEFILEFYKQQVTGLGMRDSYLKAVEIMTKKYQHLDFRHFLQLVDH